MLGDLGAGSDPRVLVGVTEGDDAGVVSLGDGEALVHTIDVITPPVDDPADFGRIAAANAVSDVFAMGGRPTSAVAFLGLPKELPQTAVAEMLKAARILLGSVGAHLVGGHTVKDKELKLGFAVTGLVDPAKMTTVAQARPGEHLVLTKALGTGILWQAMKNGLRTPEEERAVIASMVALNDRAAAAMLRAGVRAATDVTGFGLIGHAANIATHSGVDLVLEARLLPLLPGVLAYAEAGIVPGTAAVNQRGYGADLSVEGAPPWALQVASDPQTSGGLLLSAPAAVALALAAETGGVIIGQVERAAAARGVVRLRP